MKASMFTIRDVIPTRPNHELIRIRNKYLAILSEPTSKYFNSSLLKTLSGNNKIPCRTLYSNDFFIQK